MVRRGPKMMRRRSKPNNVDSLPPWTELYNTAAANGLDPSKGELLLNHPSFFTIVGGNLQGWAGAWNGFNAAELVNPPSVAGTVVSFDGSEYMDWDFTGNSLGVSVTYIIGMDTSALVSGARALGVDNGSKGVMNSAGSWAVRDYADSVRSTGVAVAGALECCVLQCTNGSGIKCYINGTLQGSAGAYVGGALANDIMTLFATVVHGNIGTGTARFFGVMDGAADAASIAIGLWGKDYLGL